MTITEDFFTDFTAFAEEIEREGHPEAAYELRQGFSCLNGLTDGWALLLESIIKVEKEHSKRLTPEQRKTLRTMRRAVKKTVYRR